MRYLNNTSNYIRSFSKLVLGFALMFMIVFNNVPFKNLSFLSTERLSILLLFLFVGIVFRKKLTFNPSNAVNRNLLRIGKFQLLLLVYACVVLLVRGRGTGESLIEIITNFLIVGGLIYVLLTLYFDNVNQLIDILFWVVLFQSIIIVLCLVSPGFASIIDDLFNQNAFFNYPVKRAEGYAAGVACITSTGVMGLSLGLIACLYKIIKNQKTIFYTIFYLFFSFIMTAVARTGLVLSLVGIALLIVASLFCKKISLLKTILSILLAAGLFVCFIYLSGIYSKLPSIFERLLRIRDNGLYNAFFVDYYYHDTTYIPELNWNTFWGIGIVSGVSGDGIRINADGGFFRAYAAMGLPLAIVHYLILLISAVSSALFIRDKSNRVIAFTFIIFILIGEYKEPFIYSRYMLVIFFVFCYLCTLNDKSVSMVKRLPSSSRGVCDLSWE